LTGANVLIKPFQPLTVSGNLQEWVAVIQFTRTRPFPYPLFDLLCQGSSSTIDALQLLEEQLTQFTIGATGRKQHSGSTRRQEMKGKLSGRDFFYSLGLRTNGVGEKLLRFRLRFY
jgi:hypothetical protein